jgi:hypothetical protein
MLGCFLGVFFAGGGWEQWSVGSGQWSVKAAVFSWANFEKCTFYMNRSWALGLGGEEQWLVVGGQWSVAAVGIFLLNGIANLHEFHFGSLVLGL